MLSDFEWNPKSPLNRQAKRQRTTKASSQTLVPNENTGTCEFFLTLHLKGSVLTFELKRTPAIFSAWFFFKQMCEKQPTSPLVEQNLGDKVIRGTPRSGISKTPLYVSIYYVYDLHLIQLYAFLE